MEKYNHQKIENKWQKKWQDLDINKVDNKSKKDKKYILDMFPYPSGAGLHVGHPEGYIATDIVSRYFRFKDFNVLHPMGWDAFGLPTENYAIKNKVHPQEATNKNIKKFKEQLQSLGFSYDWSRVINTSDSDYYKWTQWLFLQLYKKGLAYKKKAPVNWCKSCKTVLANEQVIDGKCERCDSQVIQKDLEQWFFKVTDYAPELLEKINQMDWPGALKHAQRNWIGKSEGADIEFLISNSKFQVKVFTTRPDTLFGATYLVLAPEHPLIEELKMQIKNRVEVENYIEETNKKNRLERTDLTKEKTGVELKGIKAINPGTKKDISVWIADYVIMDYSTGAIMAVPAHDERDWEFAKKFKLEIKQVIAPLFKTSEGPDAIRSDKSTVKRQTAYSLVKHWKEDKYLCLDWGEFNWHSGVIGGIEEGEDAVKAAEREIQEETGYKNLRFIREICGEHHNNFFAGHKDENRYGIGCGLLFELIDDEQEETDPEHTKNHKPIWIEGGKMSDFLNLPNFIFMWEQYQKGSNYYTGEGIMINSGKFNGLKSEEARDKITKFVNGKNQTQYKIRDWLVSRQRYWGAPIPIVYCGKCGTVPVPERDLPVLLPDDVDFKPTGESPLKVSKKFHNVKCPKCGKEARRESDTMDTFVCSSWYFLRFVDPKNEKEPFDKKLVKKWLPVDLYIGGMEHAVGHLIYARFITKVLRDLKYLTFDEPFTKIRNQGIILAEDGKKMSKRWGNVVNPDEIIKNYGADVMRMYEMFMGPLKDMKPWSQQGIIGIRRFVDKIYDFISTKSQKINFKQISNSNDPITETHRLLHKTIKKVTEDIENLHFNTAISQMMIFVNKFSASSFQLSKDIIEKFLIILSPFAPHIAEELWEKLGHKELIFKEKWPEYDKKLVVDEEVTIAIQVNGKLRETINVERGISEDRLKSIIYNLERVKKYTGDKEIKKFIYVKDKLVNIVI